MWRRLAAAGLVRLGLENRIRARFERDTMIPAAGQGALGIEVREDAHALRAHLAELVHAPTLLACEAERAVSRGLGGSCSMPLAAHAVWAGINLPNLRDHIPPARDQADIVLRKTHDHALRAQRTARAAAN